MSSTANTQKRQSILSSFVAHAKAHHEGMNQAYSAFYGSPAPTPTRTPAASASASLETSRNNSVVAGMAEAPKPKSNANKLWTALKQHHEEMNAAYTAYYSPGASRANSPRGSTSSTPRHSLEEPRSEHAAPKQPTNLSKHWKQLKTKVVEHHRGVNAAYRAAYGIGY
ncbi:hypothetical protein N0V95_000833 [Ascochyta clinopodiicola]|nr:hypothetical protein N0V95_000833 [Ascochyta clinopodiicola]